MSWLDYRMFDRDDLPKLGGICNDCAKNKGATWPTDHIATFWIDVCYICDQEKDVCAYRDWQWPRNKQVC